MSEQIKALLQQLDDHAEVTLGNISESEIAHCPGWTLGVIQDTRKLLRLAIAALSEPVAQPVADDLVLVPRAFLKNLADVYECNLAWGVLLERLRDYAATEQKDKP